MSDVKIIYIAGAGRSGSTVLAKEIAGLTNGVNVGEFFLMLTRQYMFDSDLPCSCGMQVRDCLRFGQIFNDVNLASNLPDVDKETRIRRTLLPAYEVGDHHFDSLFENLESIVGPNSIVVDSSKTPGILKYLKKRDLIVVHLLRDPRDTIKSWSSDKGYLNKKSFLSALHDWFFSNYLTLLFCKLYRVNYLRVKLEELDKKMLIKGLQDLGVNMVNSPVKSEAHILAGNPDKFCENREISEKNSSKTTVELSPIKRIIVRIVSWPLGY